MNSRISFYCFLVTSTFILAGGITYLMCPTIMPYHKQALGLEWSELNNGLQILLISSVKGMAAGAINTSIACFALLFFAKNQRWSRYLVLILSIVWLLPLMLIAIFISKETGASMPWQILALLIIIVLGGFSLSFRKPSGGDGV